MPSCCWKCPPALACASVTMACTLPSRDCSTLMRDSFSCLENSLRIFHRSTHVSLQTCCVAKLCKSRTTEAGSEPPRGLQTRCIAQLCKGRIAKEGSVGMRALPDDSHLLLDLYLPLSPLVLFPDLGLLRLDQLQLLNVEVLHGNRMSDIFNQINSITCHCKQVYFPHQ